MLKIFRAPLRRSAHDDQGRATLRHQGRSRNLHERLVRVVQRWGYAVPLAAPVRSKR